MPSPEQRILEVAKNLFTQRGFSNVAMRDICRAARVTPPTVYYHFKNKEALFNAVVRETITMSEFIKRLREASDAAHEPAARIRAFTRIYLTSFPSYLFNVGLYLRGSTELDEIGTRTLAAELARIQTILVGIIRNGIAAGAFRKTNPRMAAECLIGMMHRFVFQRIHFQRSFNASEATTYLTDFFIRAMNR